jgi:hypothetical protein
MIECNLPVFYQPKRQLVKLLSRLPAASFFITSLFIYQVSMDKI